MKLCRWKTLVPAVALLALWAGGAWAASLSGRSSTVLEWFDTPRGKTALPVYQYLLINAGDLDGEGLNFRGYGRLSDDLNDETDADSRLYYGFLEKADLIENLDLRLGRQFISTTAGASLMDGLKLDLRNLGPLKLSLFGGGDVTYYEGYDADDILAGAEVSGRFLESLHVGLSYVQTWEDGDLAKELIGLDAEYDHKGILSLYNETQYSWLTDEVTYLLAGAKYYADPKWTVRAEYLYSLPVFSATSIFSVFAASEYEEAMLEATYKIATGLNAFGRYSLEMYPEFSDAHVVEAGIEKIRTGRFSGYLVGTLRDDADGQDLHGVKARAAYLFAGKYEAGLGAHVDVLERRIEEDDETTSSRIWADATAYLTRKVNLQAKVERVESDLWDEYYRGRVRLNILF